MKTKKTLKIIANTLIWVIFAIILFTVVLTLNESQKIPNLFGVGYLSVQSDSMKGTFDEGDLIFVRVTKPTDIFKEDDIVTFKTTIGGVEVLNTHRIISVTESAGRYYYITKGDNEDNPDLEAITSEDHIVALYLGFGIPAVGKASDFIQSQLGFFLCIVLPLALIFIYQIIHFGILVNKFKKEKAPIENVSIEHLTDEQKEEIAKKYLESLNAKKDDK